MDKDENLAKLLGSQPWLRGGKDILRQALLLGKNENIRAEELSIEDFCRSGQGNLELSPVFLREKL